MAALPRSLRHISLFLQRLPGIGEKSAQRLAFFLLRMPQEDLVALADELIHLKERTKRCKECMNLSENELCEICADPQRDKTKITVVEDVMSLLSFESGNIYQGMYHVLHGRIDPLNRIGPDDIHIASLLSRLRQETGKEVKEIMLATNPDMEGEATAMYLRDRLLELKDECGCGFQISRLGYGVPIGASLEYADYMTLKKAIENRNKM